MKCHYKRLKEILKLRAKKHIVAHLVFSEMDTYRPPVLYILDIIVISPILK